MVVFLRLLKGPPRDIIHLPLKQTNKQTELESLVFSLPFGCEHYEARQAILFHSLRALGPVPGPVGCSKHMNQREAQRL